MDRRYSAAASCEPTRWFSRRPLLSRSLTPVLALTMLAGCEKQDDHDPDQRTSRQAQPSQAPPAQVGEASPRPAGERYLLAYQDATYKPGTRLEFERVVKVMDAEVLVVSPKEKLTGTTRTTQTLKLTIGIVSERQAKVLVQSDREEGRQRIGPNLNPLRQRIGALEGETIIFNLRGEGWTPELDQRKLQTGATVVRLVRELLERKSDVLLYGLKPRAVGESWTADPRHLPSLGGSNKEATGSGSMRLEFRGVENEDGMDCAVLVGRVSLTRFDALTGKTAKQGTIRVTRSLTRLADLSIAFDGRMEVIGSPTNGITISTTGPYQMTQRLRIMDTAARADTP